MPIYEYRCPDCAERFEQLVRMSTPTSEIECPKCGRREPVRLMSAAATIGCSAPAGSRFT